MKFFIKAVNLIISEEEVRSEKIRVLNCQNFKSAFQQNLLVLSTIINLTSQYIFLGISTFLFEQKIELNSGLLHLIPTINIIINMKLSKKIKKVFLGPFIATQIIEI